MEPTPKVQIRCQFGHARTATEHQLFEQRLALIMFISFFEIQVGFTFNKLDNSGAPQNTRSFWLMDVLSQLELVAAKPKSNPLNWQSPREVSDGLIVWQFKPNLLNHPPN